MAFTTGGGGGAMADINVTPLVDVMLVLLIIFMVTAPMLSYQIQIDLPQPSKEKPLVQKDPPPPVRLRIDESGALFLDNSPISKTALKPTLLVFASQEVQPTLELETSPEVKYEILTEVLATAKNAGMIKIGFVETL
jgi:biopolymer transport protein ExbD